MKLHTVTMQICDDCLHRRGYKCETPGCVSSSKAAATPHEDAALLQIDGLAMCGECGKRRADERCVTDAGTLDERQYCRECWGTSVGKTADELERLRVQLRLARLTPVGNA